MDVSTKGSINSDLPAWKLIPEELRAKNIWLRWKLEVRKGKPTKAPYCSRGKGCAKTNDPSTWSTFADAYKSKIGNGVGCVVKDGLVAIDLDKCRDLQSGVIEPWAQAIIDELDSYTELSPSGRGVHVWVRGEVPSGGNRRGRIEMYDHHSPRFMTVTGRVVHHAPIHARDLGNLHRRMLAGANPQQKTKTESADDHSASDFKFCCQLAKQGKSAEEIDAEMRKSPLFRPKWDERRGRQTYGQLTIIKAFQSTTNGGSADGRPERRLHIVSGVDVRRKITQYLWNPVFPLGTLVHFCGKSSQGKSPVTIDLLARITTGREWLDGQPNLIGPRDVLLLAIEDNLDDIIMPRFDAAGGDETRFHHCDVTQVVDNNGKLRELMIALDEDIHVLCEQARSIPELGAICIDPISNTPTDASDSSKAFFPPSSSAPALKTQNISQHARPEAPVRTKKIAGRQERAITNLLIFPTIVKAAEATRVNERTLRRWLAQPHFVARFEAAKKAILDRTVNSLVRGSERAAAELVKLTTSPKANHAVRLRASVKTLEFVMRQVQLKEVRERMAALEDALRRDAALKKRTPTRREAW